MPQFGLENIRNVVLLSHSGAGKTSLSEAIMFDAGLINRLGRVDDGTTTSDYEPEETKRHISLNLSILPVTWKDHKINIIDTPGYSDFISEVRAGIRVAEGAVIVVCAASGVEVGTEQVWAYVNEANLPRLIFLNRMDRENADYYRTVANIQAKLSPKCLPLEIPIGAQSSFQGVVNLLTKKAYMGAQGTEAEPPAELQNQINGFREKLVEAIAEADDKMIERYLAGEELALDELTEGLKKAIKIRRIVPILVGSALKNISVPVLTNAIIKYLPSPASAEVILIGADGKETNVKPDPKGNPAALVFKTSADPYVGRLSYLRVYNGVLTSNATVWNSVRGETERIGQLYTMRGKTEEAVHELRAGDIGVVAKLTQTNTGDTLTTKEHPVKVAPVTFPAPIFSAAVYPRTKTDIDKMGNALARMTEEDMTIHVRRDHDTGETIIDGMGETHLAVVVDRMSRKFGLGVELKSPKVPYQETITVASKAEYKHKKQTGGHGQYGHVVMEFEPMPIGTPSEFVERVVGGSVPRNFIPAVEKGIHEGIKEGPLAGYPITGVRSVLVDGSYHAVDSSEIAFKISAAGALKKGLMDGHPILIEPIENIKVVVPDQYTGDIIGDLNTKRARVHGMNPEDGKNTIDAQVPLAEVQRYAIDLKSMTQGRGTFTKSFSHYEVVPQHIMQKIIAERQVAKEAVAV